MLFLKLKARRDIVFVVRAILCWVGRPGFNPSSFSRFFLPWNTEARKTWQPAGPNMYWIVSAHRSESLRWRKTDFILDLRSLTLQRVWGYLSSVYYPHSCSYPANTSSYWKQPLLPAYGWREASIVSENSHKGISRHFLELTSYSSLTLTLRFSPRNGRLCLTQPSREQTYNWNTKTKVHPISVKTFDLISAATKCVFVYLVD